MGDNPLSFDLDVDFEFDLVLDMNLKVQDNT